jgi:hypothetical protein
LRVAVRVAAVLLTPLVILAVLGLSLRIGQYGLTPDRIIAAACALVGAAYAAGYGWAALSPFWRKGDWMRPLERTNIWTALLTVAVILLLFSPALDPARLSVMDQVARLERGAVTPDKFDYRFLRFESGKAGQAALARLARSTDAAVATRAKAAQGLTTPYDDPDAIEARTAPRIEMWPSGTALPPRFMASANNQGQLRHCQYANFCVATRRDLDGDGKPEILLAGRAGLDVFVGSETGDWRRIGTYEQPCSNKARTDIRAALKDGRLRATAPRWPDMEFGDDTDQARFSPDFRECNVGPKPVAP